MRARFANLTEARLQSSIFTLFAYQLSILCTRSTPALVTFLGSAQCEGPRLATNPWGARKGSSSVEKISTRICKRGG
jgi:hypothetical protein